MHRISDATVRSGILGLILLELDLPLACFRKKALATHHLEEGEPPFTPAQIQVITQIFNRFLPYCQRLFPEDFYHSYSKLE